MSLEEAIIKEKYALIIFPFASTSHSSVRDRCIQIIYKRLAIDELERSFWRLKAVDIQKILVERCCFLEGNVTKANNFILTKGLSEYCYSHRTTYEASHDMKIEHFHEARKCECCLSIEYNF